MGKITDYFFNKIYCKNCIHYNILDKISKDCCTNPLFIEEKVTQIKNPIEPIIKIEFIRKTTEHGTKMDCEYLNKDNDCPYYENRKWWQKLWVK